MSYFKRLKCTKIDFFWGSAKPLWGAYSDPQAPGWI